MVFNELRIGSKIGYERLMKTYGYLYDKKREHIYLIMEYINSKDLGNYIYLYYDKDKWEYKMPIETRIGVLNLF